MNDLVLSSVYNLDAEDIAPFVESLALSGYNGHRVMVCYDSNARRDNYLAANGWVCLSQQRAEGVHPFLQRFNDWRHLLRNMPDLGYVLAADCRDVVFQSDPSRFLDDMCGTYQFLAADEGILLKDDPWATDFCSANYPEEWEWLQHHSSFCAGTIAGGHSIMAELFGLIFRVALTGRHHQTKFCDQPAFNILCNQWSTNARMDADTDLACTCGTLLAGDFKDKRQFAPTVEWARVIGQEGPYLLVHQYDRIPELREAIPRRYCKPIANEPAKDGAYQGMPTIPKFTDNALSDIVEGKTVAIIGPSPSFNGTPDADVVVRINRGMAEGGADILYHCLNEEEQCGGPIPWDSLKGYGTLLCSPYPRGVNPFHVDVCRVMATNREHLVPFHSIDREYYLELAKATGTRPNSGICAIMDILAHNPKEVRVYGFTFFEDGHRESYKQLSAATLEQWQESDFNGNHHQAPQKMMMDDVCKSYPVTFK